MRQVVKQYEFQSTPPVWGATWSPACPGRVQRFQSTPPVWGATSPLVWSENSRSYFNPRPPCGGRRDKALVVPGLDEISIHAPRVGGDLDDLCWDDGERISIHAPRVGGDVGVCALHHTIHISIHAPRVGGDSSRLTRPKPGCYFNPRPPCGGRLTSCAAPFLESIFQSTPPVWGATETNAPADWRSEDFNPRPPCGGRHQRQNLYQKTPNISIHAPRVGGDHHIRHHPGDQVISIHAPRVGGDRDARRRERRRK